MTLRVFDTQRGEWIDLNAPQPSNREADAEPPLHPKRCGPCEECREGLADYGRIRAYQQGLAARRPRLTPAEKRERHRHRTYCYGRAFAEYAKRWDEPRPPASSSATTVDHYVRHAQLFGCESVYGTAAEHLSATELVRLKVELHRIATEHRRAKRPSSWWQGVPPIDDADLALLHAGGATADEIATMVGRSRNAVYKALERWAETHPHDDRAMEESDVI
jgi:hypothetical protein